MWPHDRRRFCPLAFSGYFFVTSRRHSRELCLQEVANGGYKESHTVDPTRLVKTQCSCSSGFSRELWPWIGSSLKYDCSLVTRGSVRFHIQSYLQITTWTRSSALIGPEGTLLVFLFQAPFTTIDMHLSGIRHAPTGTDEMHTTQGHNSNCGNALQALCGSFSCAVHPCAHTVDS